MRPAPDPFTLFAGYVEPDEAGFDMLLRARNQAGRRTALVEAASHGLTVEPDPEGFGGEAV